MNSILWILRMIFLRCSCLYIIKVSVIYSIISRVHYLKFKFPRLIRIPIICFSFSMPLPVVSWVDKYNLHSRREGFKLYACNCVEPTSAQRWKRKKVFGSDFPPDVDNDPHTNFPLIYHTKLIKWYPLSTSDLSRLSRFNTICLLTVTHYPKTCDQISFVSAFQSIWISRY